MSEYRNIKTFFVKGYVQNLREEVFVIKIVKNTVPWTYLIEDFNGKKIVGTFYEKEFKKSSELKQ